MRWEDEHYVRVYTRDTLGWRMLPWQSKALWSPLLRKVDRAGLLELGAYGAAGLATLVELPLEVVEPGLAGLLKGGCVELRETVLVVPNFIEAQETPSSDKQRKREQRERDRALARLEEVTKQDDASQIVTDRHDASREVTSGHSVLSVPSVLKDSSPRARVIERWAERHVLTPTPTYLLEGIRLIEAYAEAAKRDPLTVADAAFEAFDKLVATWHVDRRNPKQFVDKWDDIQRGIGGVDPAEKPKRPDLARDPPPSKPSQPPAAEVLKRVYGGHG